MADWSELARSLRDAGNRRNEARRQAFERAQAQQALDAWAFCVIPHVMADVAQACATRAAELERVTGQRIVVSYPVRAEFGGAATFPLHVVALTLHPVELDLYSARGPGGLPALHVVSFFLEDLGEAKRGDGRAACNRGDARAVRNRRLVSEAGCLVGRRTDGAAQLLSLAPGGTPMTTDDLAHQAFERLIRQWASPGISHAADQPVSASRRPSSSSHSTG